MAEFITIKSFEYPHEAQIIKNKLETEGIFVFLKDEYTIQTDNFLSNAIGGVKLQVMKEDVITSKEILALFKQEYQSTLQEITLAKDTIVNCPNCNSIEVRKSDKMKGFVGVILLFFGIPLPVYKKEYHCFDCYRDFKVRIKGN